MLPRVISLVFEYSAVIRLRFLEPDAERPMRAPLVYILGVPTFILGFAVLFFTRDLTVWILIGTIEGFFVLAYLGKLLYSRHWGSNSEIWIRKRLPAPSGSHERTFQFMDDSLSDHDILQ